MSNQISGKYDRYSFKTPRLTDKQVIDRMISFTHDSKLVRKDIKLELAFINPPNTISIKAFLLTYEKGITIILNREWDNTNKAPKSDYDNFIISPNNLDSNSFPISEFTRLIALSRKYFDPIDTKSYIELMDEGSRHIYEARERDLQKLERMQESFFTNLASFSTKLESDKNVYFNQLDSEYKVRRNELEKEFVEKSAKLKENEEILKKLKSEIDERENRQARRDIYKELKSQLESRNKKFELTEGTRKLRTSVGIFSLILMLLLMGGFVYCFYKNVIVKNTNINLVSVFSQIGFAFAFIGMATFYIRWNQRWFQKHADEEFKLKRLDLDIDRANWLVELSMEWKNLTKTDIPSELIDRLSRNLFLVDENKELDIHPAETMLSSILGKSGHLKIDFPSNVSISRDDRDSK